MIRIELLRDYRGIKINDELWLKGIYEVEDDLGNYLIGKTYARASSEPLPQPPAVKPPDGIKTHNKAVDDLGLPSYLKVQPPTVVSDEIEDLDYSLLSRDELLETAKKRGIEVEGTGKNGYIIIKDVLDALEGDGD